MTDVIAEPCTGVKDKACAGECPVEAIVCEDDVPGAWAQFTRREREVLRPARSPGGAAKTGPLPDDTDHVASDVTCR